MSLLDLLDRIPNFISRYLFPVYVECGNGTLAEVEKIDFRNGCAGTVLVCDRPLSDDGWDDDLCALLDKINGAWDSVEHPSEAARVFNPTADVISVEAAYRLLNETHELLNRMYNHD